MEDNLVEVGEIEVNWSASGASILGYYAEVTHLGLKEHKVLKAKEEYILENKIEIQVEKWEEKWSKLEEKRLLKEHKEGRLQYALDQTDNAKKMFDDLDNTLKHTLEIDDAIDWDTLRDHNDFPAKSPKKPRKSPHKKLDLVKPEREDSAFNPPFSVGEKIFKGLKKKKIQRMDSRFENSLKQWEAERDSVTEHNHKLDQEYEKKINGWEKKVEEFEKDKSQFYDKQKRHNQKIDQRETDYRNLLPKAIAEYCEIVLNNSFYPDFFPQTFELEYNPTNKVIIVEYELPDIEQVPKLKEVKYIATKDELKESYLTDAAINKLYDNLLYQISLRTIHELYEADVVNAIDLISFNGWVDSVSKATGKQERKCILSIQAKRDEFLEIDLSKIDPKVCFKTLKGVASSKLNTLTPIQPILQISREDKRFTDSYEVVDSIDQSTNLAAMNWEDFEHLIREMFEKEFQQNGGEVKVTKASRDGGVDAIAFDPDPIRGGKIVIQAKRYTNTVGVSAVRDLYGTVMNEGATKGILVTTADYGPDAYSFAQGKPITLLNGSNLLHLLEKHGHKAIIDIQQAKKLNQ